MKTPESIVQTVAWDQRFGRRFFFKAAYLHRNGSHAYIVDPDASRGLLTLSSIGRVEVLGIRDHRPLSGERAPRFDVSYVRSHSTRDLNDYDQFFGNFRDPIIRANENSLSPTDVPNRLIVRGNIGLPGKWVFVPIYEWRTGFPVVGGQRVPGLRRRAQSHRPAADACRRSTSRWRGRGTFRKYRFTGGMKVYNAFSSGRRARRADQHHLARLRQVLQPDSSARLASSSHRRNPERRT